MTDDLTLIKQKIRQAHYMVKHSLIILLIILLSQCKTVMDTQNTTENNSINLASSKPYSVVIDIFRKGTYKTYSYRMENNQFKAVKYRVNKEPETIASKDLSHDEAKEFEQYIYSFPLENLEDSYTNQEVKGSYHLIYHITIGDKSKSIYVYFKHQNDLLELYKRLGEFIPENEKFSYYGS